MPHDALLPSFSPGRRWKIGLNVGASILALGLVLLMLNYLAARHSRRFYWTSDTRTQLSPVTKEVLRSITNQVKVIVFFDRNKPLFDMVSDLLGQYRVECPRIDLEFVDYERMLGRAKAIQAEYDLTAVSDGDRVIFELGGRRKVVYAKDLSEFDYNAALRGQEVRRTGFKGEQLFTSALYSLANPVPARVYFLQGHHEHSPKDSDDRTGYLKLAKILEEAQIPVVALEPTALLSDDVPTDCQLLVVANPLAPLAPEEIDRIQKYLNGGGRLMVLFSLQSLRIETGLEKLLAGWGVEVGRNIVSEGSQGKAGDADQLIVSNFGSHVTVNPLARSRLLLIAPRTIDVGAKNPQSADAPKVVALAMAGPDGVAVRANGRVDREGPGLPLIVAVEKGAIQGITADRGTARIIVAGDSYFLVNKLIDYEANRDFARNAMNWLLSRDVLVQGVQPKSIKEYRIIMTASELAKVRWLFLGGFPGAVLFLGFVVWFRRRI